MKSLIEQLKTRADLYEKIRSYFRQTGAMEVVTPVLSFSGNTDPAIESFVTGTAKPMYLHTSPEFFMKRLLAAGSNSIYQIASVFRQEESGRYHNPEFSMLEWYRVGFDYQQLMDDVLALIQSVNGQQTLVEKLSYQQVFEFLKINPHQAEVETLASVAAKAGISFQSSEPLSRDQWLDLLMSHLIEPTFDKTRLTFVYDYPASQASLARVRNDRFPVAERFELYWGGVELANGFTELQDANEQRWRFRHENQRRIKNDQRSLPIDENFLNALEQGLPACSGVALGLDRLLMILTGASSIEEVMSFPLSEV